MTFITQQRSYDWIAFRVGYYSTWESGRTEEEALGKLLKTMSTCFPERGIKVNCLGARVGQQSNQE